LGLLVLLDHLVALLAPLVLLAQLALLAAQLAPLELRGQLGQQELLEQLDSKEQPAHKAALVSLDRPAHKEQRASKG
jgi:hypothetical protein